MRKFYYNYQTIVTFDNTVCDHYIKLRCIPKQNSYQKIEQSSFVLSNKFCQNHGVDCFGNHVIVANTDQEHKSLAYASTGVVELDEYLIPMTEMNSLMYLLPSKLVNQNDLMRDVSFGLTGNVLNDAKIICHWTNSHMEYKPATTNMETLASDAFEQRTGVCQDYSHLMIAMCRLNGIMARYANGFLNGVGDTHAWVEVCDGKNWYGFDPTNDNMIETGYVKIAHGRDAFDCPVCRGIYKGLTTESTFVNVTVQEV